MEPLRSCSSAAAAAADDDDDASGVAGHPCFLACEVLLKVHPGPGVTGHWQVG